MPAVEEESLSAAGVSVAIGPGMTAEITLRTWMSEEAHSSAGAATRTHLEIAE